MPTTDPLCRRLDCALAVRNIINCMERDLASKLKLNRSTFSVACLADESDEKAYWLAHTPSERLRQVKILRRINYGHRATTRLQRVLEITEGKLRE